MRSGRLFGVVVGMASFPFIGGDLSGDEVSVCGGVFNLAPNTLRDMRVAVDELEPGFNIFKVVDGFGVGDLSQVFLLVLGVEGVALGCGVDLHIPGEVRVVD